MMSDMTVPDNLTPVLMSAGTHKPTRHEWIATAEVNAPVLNEDGTLSATETEHAFALLYRCKESGVIRRFGLERAA